MTLQENDRAEDEGLGEEGEDDAVLEVVGADESAEVAEEEKKEVAEEAADSNSGESEKVQSPTKEGSPSQVWCNFTSELD